MVRKVGETTYLLDGTARICARASSAGPIEGEGPLGDKIDLVFADEKNGTKSWEMAEGKMVRDVLDMLTIKSTIQPADIDWVIAGDLLNQCTASSIGLRGVGIPFLGIYGACSTMAESIMLGAALIEGGFGNTAACITSSHYCSSEKQFRFPLELGGQRPKSSQATVTGAGGVLLKRDCGKTAVTAITPGYMLNPGVTDANNMGAAMAPAAASSIATHLHDTQRTPEYYDAIFTGDLGSLGKEMCIQLTGELGYDITDTLNDCGTMIFSEKETGQTSGASGCGCSAVVMTADVIARLEAGEMQRILFVGTGALHSPTLLNEKQPIPVIAHAVVIERKD